MGEGGLRWSLVQQVAEPGLRLGEGIAVSRTLECGLSTLLLSRGEHWKVPWPLAPGRLFQLALVMLSI